MKKLVLLLVFLSALFLLNSVSAVEFFVSPDKGDAGQNYTLNFVFSTQGLNYQKLNLTLYVPNNWPSASLEYYFTVYNDTISSDPLANDTQIIWFGENITAIKWYWDFLPQVVNLFLKVNTKTPTQDVNRTWWLNYFEKKAQENINWVQTNFTVLSPNLKIVFANVTPQTVILNSSNPEQEVKIYSVLKNEKDSWHSGAAYEIKFGYYVKNETYNLEWSPPPSSGEIIIPRLESGESFSQSWDLKASLGITNNITYNVWLWGIDQTNQFYDEESIQLPVVYSEEAQTTCAKCSVESLSCPSTVKNGTEFSVSYTINGSNKYDIQTIFLGSSQVFCDNKENITPCSISTRIRYLSAPRVCGLYTLTVSCYASELNESCYWGLADSSKTCQINVIGCEGYLPPEPIHLTVYSPYDSQSFAKGETLVLRVAVNYENGSAVTNAKVKAISSFFNLDLFDDGNHNDNRRNDGIYGNSVVLDVTPGSYSISFLATKDSSYTEKTVNIKVFSGISVNIETDRDEYNKSDTIKIRGNVLDASGNPIKDATVLITLKAGLWKFEHTTKSDSSGNFYFDFIISFGDPEGLWNISAVATDEYGNEASDYTLIEVRIPPAMVYYLLRFITPVPSMNYRRGENVSVQVEVTKGGQPVTMAKVSCRSPNGSFFSLEEIGNGIYSKIYEIMYSDPLGVWSISCEASKIEAGKPMAGGGTINTVILPVNLSIQMIKPESNELLSGETVEFLVRISYPNNQSVKGATAVLNFQGESVSFNEKERGIYEAEYIVKDKGEFNAVIKARDAYDNSAQLEKIFVIKAGFASFFEYWWLLLLIASLFVLVPILVKRKESEGIKIEKEINKYLKELMEIDEMQRVTQQEYFKRKIDEKTFRTMMEDFKRRSIECRVKIRNLREELKEIKAGKGK